MASDICRVCNKKISFLSSFVEVTCESCKQVIHKSCSLEVRLYSAWKKNKVVMKRMCKTCAEKNGQKFGSYRFCEHCQSDISLCTTDIGQCQVDGCKSKLMCSCSLGSTCLPDNVKNGDFRWFPVCPEHAAEVAQIYKNDADFALRVDCYGQGYKEGHDDGYDEGYHKGHDDGYDEGHHKGHYDGYNEGYDDGSNTC